MSPSPGTRLGPYEILALLGSGGMGEVYRARDTRLSRAVAIKLLPEALAADTERLARFQHEARAASALNHPHIVTIYDIGQRGPAHYIAMELVDGWTLRELLAAGPLPMERVLRLSSQIAEGLAKAHAAGIVHRDLKPENIMVSRDGFAKILDFGLAKLSAPDTADVSGIATIGASQTQPGWILGTVGYMSPEQATGRPIDARSDQFALGAILYEMVTGLRAFPGDSAIEILTALVRDDPKPLEEAGIDVPAPLAWIIGRCLAKDPAERYGSTGDLAHDLRHVPERLSEGAAVRTKAGTSSGSGPAPRSIDSLAVLPFENASADSEAEYLSDGIAESLINALSSLRSLRVVPRSTVFRYKGTDRDPRSVGRELAVRAVLTGRVAQRGNLLTVQAELVDVAHHSQIWGVRYDRRVADILAVEEEISGEIAEKLRLELSGSEKQRLADRSTRDTEAYRLYLKGRFYWNKRTRAALEKAIEFFEQATEADSRYALAYAGLAECRLLLCAFGAFSPQKAEGPIMAAAGRALELDGRLASAHTAIAFLRQLRWDWTGAWDGFRRALELDPSDATTHNWYANHLAALGRFEEAITEAKQAVELDPLSLTWNFGVGHMLYLARRYDEAIAQARRTLEMDEHYPFGYWLLGLAHEQKGETARCVASIDQADRLSGGFLFTTSLLGRAYALAERTEEAEKILDRLRRQPENEYVSPAFLGLVQAALGDRDGAFESLRQSAEEGSYVLFFAKVSPIFDDLRDDPRFEKLLRKIGLNGETDDHRPNG